MRARILLTLIFSFSLIGVSLVFRFSSKNGSVALTTVANQEIQPAEIVDIADISHIASSTPSTPLSDTDLISRQLFSEYIQVSMNGQSTTPNLQILGGKYAEGILNQYNISSSQKISAKNLLATKDSPALLSQYEKQITTLHEKYAGIAKALSVPSPTSDDIADPALQKFFTTLSTLYKQAAGEFGAMAVPASFLQTHAALVNNYLSSAEMMQNLSAYSDDPLKLYAVIKKQTENQKEEEELFKHIELSLKNYGASSNTSL